MTNVERIQMRIEILGEGVMPEFAATLTNTDDLLPVELTKPFYPFHKEPAAECAFYIGNEELFGHPGAKIRIDFDLSDAVKISGLNPSSDLQLAWEYFDGTVNPKGVEESLRGFNFDDSTFCFTRNGTVSFTLPADMTKIKVMDQETYWVRVRILKGDYGQPGMYMLDGDKWAWFDERPLRPPQLKNIRIKYEEASRTPARVLTYNDFRSNALCLSKARSPSVPRHEFVFAVKERFGLHIVMMSEIFLYQVALRRPAGEAAGMVSAASSAR